MKYSQIDFETITKLNRELEKMKVLFNEDYHTLIKKYMKNDWKFIQCFTEHRTLNSDLRSLDFVPVTDECFRDRRYIYSRLKKMDRGIKTLVGLKRI